MAETIHIITSYVTPGGIGTLPVQGGHVTCRVTLGHLTAEDGLIAELEGRLLVELEDAGAHKGPLPWASKQAKTKAMEVIRNWQTMDDALRERLLAHLAAAPFYEPGVR